jgi:serine/threonine protein phosphatase PrpC
VALAAGRAAGKPYAVLVVCDGVSSSSHAEQASEVAARTACELLEEAGKHGDTGRDAERAMVEAIRSAHLAVCRQHLSHHGLDDAPGTTIVAAYVFRGRLTVGWEGDSRAYLLGAAGAEQVTRDHSWVREVVERGEMSEQAALLSPNAHALTRCLGPLESEDAGIVPVDPDVASRPVRPGDHVLVCSDGLWNYFPAPQDIARLVRSAGKDATPTAIARVCVQRALARGGQDNITVAVHRS